MIDTAKPVISNTNSHSKDRLNDLESQIQKKKEENAILTVEVTQLQQRLHEQASTIRRMRNSRAFKWTKPFQRLNDWWEQRILLRTPVDVIPCYHVTGSRKKGRDIWISLGNDPQFLIQPVHKNITRKAGWFMLEYDFQSTHVCSQQLFFDIGTGFTPAISLTWEAPASGKIALPVYLPTDCHALRLDPLTHKSNFQIDRVFLRRLPKRPKLLAAQNIATYDYLEHHKPSSILGQLTPIQQLSKIGSTQFHWLSVGEDPYFFWDLTEISKLQAGWYIWEFKFQKPDGSNQPTTSRLYLDTGDGFNETETVNLPLSDGDVTSHRVFLSKKNIKRIRFDPIDYPGELIIEALSIKSINEAESQQLMLDHLSLHHPNYLEKDNDSILLDIQPLSDASHRSSIEIISSLYEETQNNNHSLIDYKAWISTVEVNTVPSNQTIEQSIAEFSYKPLISVVMPTYNTPEKYLRLCIESIINQSYPYWELCIADDHSPQTHVKTILEEYAQRDHRIKYTIRETNGHISAASNSALALATGDFVALLDHDDELPSYALYFIAEAINNHPKATVIYSDEDKIDEGGERFEPHFKSDWNPDLFFSQNYVSHLGVYRRDLLEKTSGFRLGVEGSQDQDLLLRCLPHIDSRQIIHVPRVLYHWRTLPGSTAMAAGEKTYTTDAGIKALEDYFKQTGQHVQVEMGKIPNTYRTHYPIPTPAPLVSLLIPTRDKLELVETAVHSILEKSTYHNFEILILDNGSVEKATLNYFTFIQAQDSRVRVLRWDFPFNYSAINNFGAHHAKGEILGLINNDIEVINPEWLHEMVSHAIRPEIGCVGAKLYYPDDTIQHAGVLLGVGGVANHAHLRSPRSSLGPFARLTSVQNFSAVTAAVLLVKKSIFDQVNGLNEKDLSIAFNDVDFCLRVLQLGFRNLWTPYAELYHYESISRGTEDNPEKLARFSAEVKYMKTTWTTLLEQDPMYNPNLNREKPDYSIASDKQSH